MACKISMIRTQSGVPSSPTPTRVSLYPCVTLSHVTDVVYMISDQGLVTVVDLSDWLFVVMSAVVLMSSPSLVVVPGELKLFPVQE